MADWTGMLKRGLSKPTKVILRRLQNELQAEADRFLAPKRLRMFCFKTVLKEAGDAGLDALWLRLGARPYPAVSAVDLREYERTCPGDRERILGSAESAMARQANLLGSGPVDLGNPIDWHKDYKTGHSWPPAYFRDIDYNNPDRPSDVKFTWELSRMQWMIPLGQAYTLTKDERYASFTRGVLDDWISANPYAHSVNWACTMEAAMRIFTWTWFFHVFKNSLSWEDAAFRERFLCCLFLHGDFTERYLEYSDINGNHCTADAAALVFAGLFWGEGKTAGRWLEKGWQILCEEVPRQVFDDGVDFEASTAYHRLVLELFFLSALYRETCGLDVSEFYKYRVIAMARFVNAYSRPDGTIPLWGDTDDARVLPFGWQDINDHRYLAGLVGVAWGVDDLCRSYSGSFDEIYWVLGDAAVNLLETRNKTSENAESVAFPDGGFYVMRTDCDHVFIDCGPIGLAGRGGHGHNDCLSFEAMLDGVCLITDSGSYVYTASYEWRNRFRSTSYHNTPMIDGEEQNRFIGPDYLWTMHYDAVPQVLKWSTSESKDLFEGSHKGYGRLTDPVMPVRSIALDRIYHRLVVRDRFEGEGGHAVSVPFHLAPRVTPVMQGKSSCLLEAGERNFLLLWGDADAWDVVIEDAWVSPSYGIKVPTYRLKFSRDGALTSLTVVITPVSSSPAEPLAWADNFLEKL